jgi:predicted nucleic acid-binding protein
MRTAFVIDASVIISWCDPREKSEYGHKILECLEKNLASAPIICCMEVNNVFWQFEKRGIFTQGMAQKAIGFVSSLPIILDDKPIEFRMPRVAELANNHDLTIYDSCYLELAVRLGLPLATMDKRLHESAENAGLSLYEG